MQALVKQIKVGKRVGGDLYFHRDAISTLAPQMQSMLSSLIQQYAPNTPFDILKISPKALTLSLLSSPSFFESSYPTVQASQTISFKQAPPTSTMARYDERTSPPIYHRTETFLPPQHPRYAELAGRTKRAEELGLYQGEMQKLGNQAAWDEWLAEQGFSEKDGSIVPLEETYQPPLRRFSSSQPSSGVVMPGRERLPELPPGYSIEQELEKIEYAKSTSRKGKLADQALVPRVVAQMVPVGARILDFGAGKYQIHANKLRDMGHDVTAHDFSDVNPDALNRQYDVVYASNVLNVQGSPTMLAYTIQQIHSLVKPGGVFIGNFPADPRPNPYNAQRLLQAISTYFGRPVQIIGGLVHQFGGGGKPSPVSKANAPVFIVQKRDEGNREKNPSAESEARLHREVAAAMGRNPNPKSVRSKAAKATGTQKRRIPNAKPRGRTVVAERKNKRRIPNAELSPAQLSEYAKLPPDTRWYAVVLLGNGGDNAVSEEFIPRDKFVDVFPDVYSRPTRVFLVQNPNFDHPLAHSRDEDMPDIYRPRLLMPRSSVDLEDIQMEAQELARRLGVPERYPPDSAPFVPSSLKREVTQSLYENMLRMQRENLEANRARVLQLLAQRGLSLDQLLSAMRGDGEDSLFRNNNPKGKKRRDKKKK
jgi:SAM-dependent methyltransferase